MARDNFNADLDLRQQYLSLVYVKIPGEANWTLMDQGRVLTPNQTAEEQDYARIGGKDKTKIGGAITTDVTVQVYVEDDIEELAKMLGTTRPGGGWVGTEVIQLDPTKLIDIKINNYDGVTTAANILFVEYINAFKPLNLSINLDAEGDVRIADLSGAATAYYIIPAAGT